MEVQFIVLQNIIWRIKKHFFIFCFSTWYILSSGKVNSKLFFFFLVEFISETRTDLVWQFEYYQKRGIVKITFIYIHILNTSISFSSFDISFFRWLYLLKKRPWSTIFCSSTSKILTLIKKNTTKGHITKKVLRKLIKKMIILPLILNLCQYCSPSTSLQTKFEI